MAGTVTVSSNTIAKKNRAKTEDVWEVVLTYVLGTSSGGDEIKQAIALNGTLKKIIAKSGDATGISGTFTLAIDDNGNNEIFTASGPAEGATSVWNVSEAITGEMDIGVNPSDDPTSGTWTITITLRGI